MKSKRYNIGKMAVSQTNLNHTVAVIEKAIENKKPGYICVSNTRTTYLANHDSGYCQIQNESMLTVPDGTPLVWNAHLLGYKETGRVTGPELMLKMLELSREKSYSHYFYGSSPMVIQKMKDRLKRDFPEIKIQGMISPPFQPIENFDIDALADEINLLEPDIFWCGLGAPKQERIISVLQPKLNSTICIGVGLAFDFYAGTVIPPPKVVAKLKLEWLFRNIQQPEKARKFVKPFFWMVGMLAKNLLAHKILRKQD